MWRREFFSHFGIAIATWPLAARAQQKAMPVVGFLSSAASGQAIDLVAAWNAGLKEGGFTEGRNVKVEYRWADNNYDLLPALANDLVGRRVDTIVTGGGDRSAIAAKHATSAIPIVAVIGGDPVAEGLVTSLAHPGGNLTGVSFLTASLTTKRLQLLLELAPSTRSVVLLVNPNNPQTSGVVNDVGEAVLARRLEFHNLAAGTEAQIGDAFAVMDRLRPCALIIEADPFFNNIRRQLISLATRHSVPAIHERRAFVAEGGLISYGTSLPDVYRQIGVYVGEILNGGKPADLPVVQPTKFELAINAKAAESLVLPSSPFDRRSRRGDRARRRKVAAGLGHRPVASGGGMRTTG